MAETAYGMNESAKILIVSFTDHNTDPRVRKQVKALTAEGYEVHTVGKLPSGINRVHFSLPAKSYAPWKILVRTAAAWLGLDRWSLLLRYDTRAMEKQLTSASYALVLCNDLEPLPFALKIKGAARLLWDAHEYYPGEMDHDWRWRFFYRQHVVRVLRRAVPHIDAAFTVSPEIAGLYASQYGLRCEVLMNLPDYAELSPSPVLPGKIRLVHHGNADPARRLDEMIGLLRELDERYELHLYLTRNGPSQQAEYKRLRTLASSRVVFHEPVKPHEIVAEINRYDLGIITYPNEIPELNFCMPNKFFEFIQARLGIVVGQLETMANFTRTHGLGVVSGAEGTGGLLHALRAMDSAEVERLKVAADRVAQHYHAGVFSSMLAKKVRNLLA